MNQNHATASAARILYVNANALKKRRFTCTSDTAIPFLKPGWLNALIHPAVATPQRAIFG